jgi:2-amino-4-hydroxy-6-hydroxymethyldihydropteridine diphosphokinase
MFKVDVFLGLGSNLGNSKENIFSVIEQLHGIEEISYIQHSKLYKTTPVNCESDANFINAVCHIRTKLSPEDLYKITANIEKKLGKVKKSKNQSRLIDIDILLYGDLIYESKTLSIPHPRWKERLFVLIPLSDLVDEILIPVGKISIPFRIKDYISSFVNSNNEKIEVIENA